MRIHKNWMLCSVAGSAFSAGIAGAQDLGALEKRVQALEKSGGGQAVTRTKKTMSLTVSGHINRAVQFRDNGTKSGVLHVTNNMSRSRVRWIGTGRITDDLSVETKIELGNQSSISSAQDLGDNADVGDGVALDTRHFDLIVTSKTYGKLWIGQGETASDNTSEYDLSGTGLVTLNGDIPSLAGSETFRLSSGAPQGRVIADVFNNFDGSGRRDRVRYDTPKFAGFNIAVSHHNGDAWDAGLHYGASIGSVKVSGGLGYADDSTSTSQKRKSGSLSVLFPFGLNLTVGLAARDNDAAGGIDSDWRYGKVGYRFKPFSLGETRIAAEYNVSDDVAAVGEDARYVGFGLVQTIESLGSELYFSYHNVNLDVPNAADPEKIDIVTVGARVLF